MSVSPLQTLLEERLNAASGLGWDAPAQADAPAAAVWRSAAAYVAALLQRLRIAA